MRQALLAFAVCSSLRFSTAHAISGIGVFADAAGTDCDITIMTNTPFNLYVVAWTAGDVAETCGIQRADLRVTGVPASWFVNVIPNPSGSSAGNILAAGGSIDFPGCQPPGPSILVYTLFGFATSSPANFQIRAEARTDVTDDCSPTMRPTLTACDEDGTRICALQSVLFVNGPLCRVDKPAATPAAGGTCLVAIEGQNWGAVKRLYGD